MSSESHPAMVYVYFSRFFINNHAAFIVRGFILVLSVLLFSSGFFFFFFVFSFGGGACGIGNEYDYLMIFLNCRMACRFVELVDVK